MARRPLVQTPPIAQAETRVSTLPPEPEDDPQLSFVVNRLMQAWSREQIVGACRERFGIGQYRTTHLIRQVLEGLRSAHERNAHSRVEQIGRLRSLIAELHLPRYHPTKTVPGRDAAGNPVDVPLRLPKAVREIERVERLLAELEGNRQPERIEVSVTMTAAMAVVIGQMSGERLQEFVERARERRRLALVASNGNKVA